MSNIKQTDLTMLINDNTFMNYWYKNSKCLPNQSTKVLYRYKKDHCRAMVNFK